MADPVVYKTSLTILNIFLMVASTVLLFSGLVLLSVYHMAKVNIAAVTIFNIQFNSLTFLVRVLVLALLCHTSQYVNLGNLHIHRSLLRSTHFNQRVKVWRKNTSVLTYLSSFRVMNILLAVFLSIAFIGQIFSVFSTEELRNKIEMDIVPRRELEWVR